MNRHSMFGMVMAVLLPAAVSGDVPVAKAATAELLSTRHLAVMVTIDGKGPFRMIFDTGSPVVLVNSKIAKECGLNDPKRPKPKGKLGQNLNGQIVLNSIEIGGAKAENVPATVLDHPTVKAIEGIVGEIDGIVGYPFFGRFRTAVDYEAKTIAFAPNGHEPVDVFQALMAGLNNRGKPTVLASAGQWGLEVEKPEGDKAAGVIVRRLYQEAPALTAGLKHGDRILTIDGRWTDSVADCHQAASLVLVGRDAVVEVRRADQTLKLTVRPRAGS